jgi:mannose-6-phosphate isomerase
MLYPLKFKPLLKERIWGGSDLRNRAGVRTKADVPIGESWEISGFEDEMSVVAEGRLKGNSIGELTEVFMGELVGDKVYEAFGCEFPLLVKYTDAQDMLSVQVHPGNALAARLHGAWGKSEMWYITECEEDAEILVGFKEGTTPEKFAAALSNGTITDLLNRYTVHKGDAFYIPAGTVHCICGGIKLVEIQQTSDITYRIYDWERTDNKGNPCGVPQSPQDPAEQEHDQGYEHDGRANGFIDPLSQQPSVRRALGRCWGLRIFFCRG